VKRIRLAAVLASGRCLRAARLGESHPETNAAGIRAPCKASNAAVVLESCAIARAGTGLAFASAVLRARRDPSVERQSSGLARLALLVVAAALQQGCVLSTDLGGTEFLCSEEPVCPEGTECVDGRCVAGGGATGDDGSEGDDGGDEGDDGSDDGGDDGGGDGGDDGGDPPPSGFAFRQQLTIANAGREELVDFPILVVLDARRIDYSAVRGDGADLQFRDPDGALLAHEVERWNPEGQSFIWVRVPVIDAGSDGDFVHMYYGNPEAKSDQDEAAVWTAYEEVYHLDAEKGEVDDAGERDLDGDVAGAEGRDGVIGRALQFDGVSQHVDLGGGRDFARAAPGLTVEAWVHPDVAQQGVIFGAAVATDSSSRVELRYELNQGLRGGARTQKAGDLQAVTTQETLELGDWSWVALVCDFSAGQVSIYIDDHLSVETGGLAFDGQTPDTPSSRAVIAADESIASDFFAGRVDELRVARTALPAGWLAAQNASMRDQLLTYGAPEAL
jgi:Concanavalin A-like lectin/glucanases superfamily/Domain of unknown function (DUF2341)